MSNITKVQTGVVYRNTERGNNAYFPSVIELKDESLLATLDIGTEIDSIDKRSYCCRSNDGGQTWTDPENIFEPDTSAHPISTTCRTSVADEQTLVGWVCLFNRVYPEFGHVNTETKGFVKTDFATVYSYDNGVTWSGLNKADLPMDWNHFETCSPIVRVDHDRWMVPTSPWPNWDGHKTAAPDGLAWASNDKGKTWTERVTLFEQNPDYTAWEQKIVRLSDGRLMVVCWTYDHVAKASRPNRFALSADGGESFSEAYDAPICGETCTPVALDDDHILFIYRRYDQPGLWAHLAKLDGDRWVGLADNRLWAGSCYGDSADDDQIMKQMSQLQFGCPSAIRLMNGDILITFWCVEDGVSNIRWIRFTMA